MTVHAATKKIPTTSVLQYSFLALPLAFAGLPLYIHAPDFYARDLGMSIGLIGLILMAVRLFDAVQDPFIGYVSDRNTSRRYSIVLIGGLLLMSGMTALFIGPIFSINIAVWFAVSMILATTGFSIVTINLNMIGGFLSNDKEKRTSISAWRESFALIGLLLASVLPAALQNTMPADEAFKILLIVFAVIAVIAFLLFTRFMRNIDDNNVINSSKTNKGFSFFSILMSRDKLFFGVCFLTHLAAALPGVMVLFFIRDYLQLESLTGLFLLLYFLSGAVLMPVWVMLAKKIGKDQAWLYSMFLAVGTFIWAFFLSPGDVWAYGAICILSGIALGADLALPPSIVADRVTANKTEGEATQYYALLAFIPKLAVALASGISFLILDQLGFRVGEENTQETMQSVLVLYALVPCMIKLTAAASLWFMSKREGELNENNERISTDGTINIS